jgi:peptidoglycan/LPS O-acetylase OafA/YrhL
MPAPVPETHDTARRIDVLDGLRGVAIVLVVLSHGWVLWPVEWFDQHWVVRPVMRSGNSMVTVFLVASGFLTYRALTARRGLEGMRPEVTFLRRVVRVAPSLWVMLAVLMVVAAVDPTDTTPRSANVDSVQHVVTYTWNWYVQGNLLTSRPDFGHLWYLSVDMQAFVLMAWLLYVMRRRPVGVLFLLSGLWLLLTWWRMHAADTEFVFQVLVRTSARMDAFVLGVLVAALVTLLQRLPSPIPSRYLTAAMLTSLGLLVPLLWWNAADPLGDGDHQFLHLGGTMLQLDLAVLIGAVALATSLPAPVRALGRPSLAFLGERSLLLYIWHYPVFRFVERHLEDRPWQLKTLVAAALTVAICVLCELLVERQVVRLLRHRSWRRLEPGLPAFLGTAVSRRLPARVRERLEQEDAPLR